ncbi:MAG: hypothetical protein V7K69_23405 [Nostoc sp.]|uniref:hypothetical protein n=1 Tax=Nostoc sp. TaxID=1180 RepID=UPI002FFB4F00
MNLHISEKVIIQIVLLWNLVTNFLQDVAIAAGVILVSSRFPDKKSHGWRAIFSL